MNNEFLKNARSEAFPFAGIVRSRRRALALLYYIIFIAWHHIKVKRPAHKREERRTLSRPSEIGLHSALCLLHNHFRWDVKSSGFAICARCMQNKVMDCSAIECARVCERQRAHLKINTKRRGRGQEMDGGCVCSRESGGTQHHTNEIMVHFYHQERMCSIIEVTFSRSCALFLFIFFPSSFLAFYSPPCELVSCLRSCQMLDDTHFRASSRKFVIIFPHRRTYILCVSSSSSTSVIMLIWIFHVQHYVLLLLLLLWLSRRLSPLSDASSFAPPARVLQTCFR